MSKHLLQFETDDGIVQVQQSVKDEFYVRNSGAAATVSIVSLTPVGEVDLKINPSSVTVPNVRGCCRLML